MRTVSVALLALALVACGEPYRYEKRGADLVRIDKRSGRAEVLREGRTQWAPVAEAQVAQVAAAAPSAMEERRIRPLTSDVTDYITVHGGLVDDDPWPRVVFTVTNNSTWEVHGVKVEVTAGTVRKVFESDATFRPLEQSERGSFDVTVDHATYREDPVTWQVLSISGRKPAATTTAAGTPRFYHPPAR